MADIRPFRGVRYNQSLVGDLAAVICPPYDIIPPHMREELYHRSEYNFVRLEYTRDLPQDTPSDNRYTRAAATLEQWLSSSILKADERPAFYLHDHFFPFEGKEYRRRGLIACIRLEGWDRRVVRPHEGTMAEPKGDRLNLLWALQANTSSVFTLYEDTKGAVSGLLAAQEPNKPVIRFGINGERHEVRAISESSAVSKLSALFATKPLYIADGHHRYESALNYQRQRLACSPAASGNDPFNFVMTTMVDFTDPGLLILPPHRLVRGLSKTELDNLTTRLGAFFEIEKLVSEAPALWRNVEVFLSAGNGRLVLVGPAKGQVLGLRLRNSTEVSQMMPQFHSDLYKKLDVSVVDHVILEEILGVSRESEAVFLGYSYDQKEALNKVWDQEFQLAFLLSPVRAEQIKAIADIGDRMPRKSTYFYPKLPSGLVFYLMTQAQ